MALVRVLGLTLTAIVAEIFKGLGAAAFVCAFILGWRGAQLFWTTPFVFIGAALSLSAASLSGDKVDHALSNGFFVLAVYFAICLLGFLTGRKMRFS